MTTKTVMGELGAKGHQATAFRIMHKESAVLEGSSSKTHTQEREKPLSTKLLFSRPSDHQFYRQLKSDLSDLKFDIAAKNLQECKSPGRLSSIVSALVKTPNVSTIFAFVSNPVYRNTLAAKQLSQLISAIEQHSPDIRQKLIECYFSPLVKCVRIAQLGYKSGTTRGIQKAELHLLLAKTLVAQLKDGRFTQLLYECLNFFKCPELLISLLNNQNLSHQLSSTELSYIYHKYPMDLYSTLLSHPYLCRKVGYGRLLIGQEHLLGQNLRDGQISTFALDIANRPDILAKIDYALIRKFTLEYHQYFQRLPVNVIEYVTPLQVIFLQRIFSSLNQAQTQHELPHWRNLTLAWLLVNRPLPGEIDGKYQSIEASLVSSDDLSRDVHQVARALATDFACQTLFGHRLTAEFARIYYQFCSRQIDPLSASKNPFPEFARRLMTTLADHIFPGSRFVLNTVCSLWTDCPPLREYLLENKAFANVPKDFKPPLPFLREIIKDLRPLAYFGKTVLTQFILHYPRFFYISSYSYLFGLTQQVDPIPGMLNPLFEALLSAPLEILADPVRLASMDKKDLAFIFSGYVALHRSVPHDLQKDYPQPSRVLDKLVGLIDAREPTATEQDTQYKSTLMAWMLVADPKLDEMVLQHCAMTNLASDYMSQPQEFLHTLVGNHKWLAQLDATIIADVIRYGLEYINHTMVNCLMTASLEHHDENAWLREVFENLIAMPAFSMLVCHSPDWLAVCAKLKIKSFDNPQAIDSIYHTNEKAAMNLLQSAKLMDMLDLDPTKAHTFNSLSPRQYLEIATKSTNQMMTDASDTVSPQIAWAYAKMLYENQDNHQEILCEAAKILSTVCYIKKDFPGVFQWFKKTAVHSARDLIEQGYHDLKELFTTEKQEEQLKALEAFWLEYSATHPKEVSAKPTRLIDCLASQMQELEIATLENSSWEPWIIEDPYEHHGGGIYPPSGLLLDEERRHSPPRLRLPHENLGAFVLEEPDDEREHTNADKTMLTDTATKP